MNSFYKSWKRKTKLEETAIKNLKQGKKILFNNIPKKEIIAIYVKGSFARREMNKKSDIDVMTILKKSKYLQKLQSLDKKYEKIFKPQVQFIGYSIWELKNNKRIKVKGKPNRASPSRAVQHLEHYKLIYGKALGKKDLVSGTEIGHLKGMIHAFKDIFLPGYRTKKFGFSEVAKQVFWLVENEQKVLGNKPPHSFKKLAKSIKDKNHIIHDALKYRKKKTKDKRKRAAFVKKLERYLERLEKRLK